MSHKYGLENLQSFLRSRNYSWSEKNYKKVTLINVHDCEDKITLTGMMRLLMGTGHLEWEALLSGWLIEAVLNAIKNGEYTADITKVFSRELSAYNSIKKHTFAHEEHVNFLMEKLFQKVEESDDELKVKLINIA